MLNYETFCYLQNQKTASTFVETFLRKFSAETLLGYAKHRAPREKEIGKFYFINVREPLDLYLSLYNFGLDKQGGVYTAFSTKGLSSLYERGMDGFDEWLSLILDPEYGRLITREYEPHAKKGIGLASWRYLRLATFAFTLDKPAVDCIVRYEFLVSDLTDVVRNRLARAITDVTEAVDWIESSQPINASTRRDRTLNVRLSPATKEKLLKMECHLYDNYYQKERDLILSPP